MTDTAVHTLSSTDSLWLNMDSPENLMVIESVMWFHDRLDAERVIHQTQTRVVDVYPVFHWRPVLSDGVGAPDRWEEMPDFDIHDHFGVVELPGDGGRTELQDFIEAHLGQPLPKDRPLWQSYILQGKNFGALMTRYHHAIADGTALARVLFEVTTDAPDDDLEASPIDDLEASPAGDRTHPLDVPSETSPEVPDNRAPRRKRERALNALTQVATLPLVVGVKATEATAKLVRTLDLDDASNTLATAAAQGVGTAEMIDKLLVATAPDLAVFGPPGVTKRADWAAPYDVEAVKRAARVRGGTVNDFMLAALSGALRRYLEARGESPVDVSTMIPVNLRPINEPLPPYLGNKFALVMFELPVGSSESKDRLDEAKRRMDKVKAGPEALLTFAIAGAVGKVGTVTTRVSRPLTTYFSDKSIGVTTNVPGPRTPRYMAGQELVGVLGWVPGAGRQALGTCIFSYNGQIRVGFKADASVIPDVTNLVQAFDAEIRELLRLADE